MKVSLRVILGICFLIGALLFFYRGENHYALIGMACCADNYPLYYDAINEKGLGMAGLKFCRKCSLPAAF